MARLWQSGAELNSLTAGVEFTSIGVSPTISASTVRTGTYSIRYNTSTSQAHETAFNFSATDINGPIYARFYINVAVLPSANTTIIVLNDGGAFYGARIRLTTTGTLILFDNLFAQVGSASSVLNTGQWYRVELSFYNNTGTGKAELASLLDGTTFASTTTNTNTGTVQRVRFGNLSAATTVDFYADDFAVNDSTGSFQTSYPGAGGIIHLKPSATGDSNDWTRGGADSGANWSQTDEVTPNDATDYNSSNTLNQEDLFNVEDSPATVGVGDTINVVAIGGRFRNDVSDATSSFKLEVEKTTGGTKSQSIALILNSVTWKTNSNSNLIPFNYKLVTYQDPDSSNWTKSTLDSMQIGVILSAATANNIQLSTIWASVDFNSGSGTTTSTSTSTTSSTSTSSTTTSSSTSSTTTSKSTSSSTTKSTSTTRSTSTSSTTTSTSKSTSTSSTQSVTTSTSSTTTSSSTTRSTSTTKSTSTSSTTTSSSTTTILETSTPLSPKNKTQMSSGVYTGDGTSSHSINGIGFAPSFVWIWTDNQYAVWSSTVLPTNTTLYFANAAASFTGGIIGYLSDGFIVGNHATVNTSSIVYYYIAIRDNGAGNFHVGSYVGTGSTHVVTGVGFNPDFLFIKGDNSVSGGYRFIS